MPNPVLIAVPPHLVPAVADLIANDGQPAAAPAAQFGVTAFVNDWSEAQLRQHYVDSSEKMRAFLLFLADHADEEVTTHAAAQVVGYPDWNSIAGMLGAAGRRASNHFGRELGPWHQRWAGDDQARLKMPANVAAVILAEATNQGDR